MVSKTNQTGALLSTLALCRPGQSSQFRYGMVETPNDHMGLTVFHTDL